MSPDNPDASPPGRPAGDGVVRALLDALVIPLVLLDELVRPLYLPLVRLLRQVRLIQRLERRVAQLPPYGVLAAFLVPFVIFEPLKVLGLYWLGTGRVRIAIGTLILSHGATFLLVERIYDAGRLKLLTIDWFARIALFVEHVRDVALIWLRSRPAWIAVKAYVAATRARIGSIFARIRTRLAGRS